MPGYSGALVAGGNRASTRWQSPRPCHGDSLSLSLGEPHLPLGCDGVGGDARSRSGRGTLPRVLCRTAGEEKTETGQKEWVWGLALQRGPLAQGIPTDPTGLGRGRRNGPCTGPTKPLLGFGNPTPQTPRVPLSLAHGECTPQGPLTLYMDPFTPHGPTAPHMDAFHPTWAPHTLNGLHTPHMDPIHPPWALHSPHGPLTPHMDSIHPPWALHSPHGPYTPHMDLIHPT